MNKIKLITVMITTMLISIAGTSLVGAVELDGKIEAEITQYVGVVTPRICLDENQTKSLSVEKIEGNVSANETDRYYVNDTISIEVNVTDNSGRKSFLIARSVYSAVVVMRDFKKVPLLPIFGKGVGYINRLFPVIVYPNPLKKEGVVDITSPRGDHYLNISIYYEIANGTTSENLTMYIFVMGFIPGNVNGGLAGSFPFIDYKKINLTAEYQEE